MRTTLTIFRKELIDSIRDRRTLMTMIVMPLLLFPLLIGISSRVMSSQIQKARDKVLKVALLANDNAGGFRADLVESNAVNLYEDLSFEEARALVESDSLDALIEIDPAFDIQVAAHRQGKISLYYKSTEKEEIETDRVREMLEAYELELKNGRFRELGLAENIDDAVDLREYNIATMKERIAGAIGGFLPYLFIIFCFTGSMYPAIDLAAGEKERGTLETLLTSPAGKFQILLGKFGVVVLTGILSAAVSILGLYLGVIQIENIPTELLNSILSILETRSIVLLLTLLLPLTAFFAGILLSLSIMAKSFKEAQSILTPMMMVVIVPAFIGMLPGMELGPKTALIPILNVSLATKSIIAGNVSAPLLAEVYISLVVIAMLSLLMCARVFKSESCMFRST